MNSRLASAQTLLAHELHNATIVIRMRCQCLDGILFARTLDLHERRGMSVSRPRCPGATIDLEHHSDRTFTSCSDTTNAHGWAVRKRALVQDPVHEACKVHVSYDARNR